MRDYLKHYRLKITALAPIHIGDGTSVGKKEYIRIPKLKQVIIPDKQKMFAGLQQLNRVAAFERFMLDDTKSDLGQWIADQRIPDKYLDEWTDYVLNAADAFKPVKNGGKVNTPKDINCFIKDAYGMAYVPGSSIKGMIRTALAAYELNRHRDHYAREINALQNRILGNAYGEKSSRKSYLAKETNDIEAAVFNTLDREGSRKNDAVNSIMSGLIVSDSEAVSTDNLTLSQKIDYTIDGNVKPLPLLRETLIPGTEILFDLTIDKNICGYDVDDIISALDFMNEIAYKYFYKRFHRGSCESGTIWLGGGAGFLSKTLLYVVYKDKAVEMTDNVFRNTQSEKIYRAHHHDTDFQKGLAPHVCKCTMYNSNLYDMGMGRIEVIE